MGRFVRTPIALAIALVAAATPLTGGTSPRSIVATKVTMAPSIDGYLADPVWQMAVPATGFLQSDPDEGSPSTERTEVRVLYDDDALYVGVMCYDSEPDKIVRQLTRRDRTGQSDRVSVIIDSYHDHSTAFLFSGTASGIESDGVLSQDGRVYDIQWDAIWDFNAAVVPNGWSAEFRIPYSALRFSEQDSEYVWGINFRRYISRKQETDEWVMVPRKDQPIGIISSVSGMGHVSGIRAIHPPLHLDILPYFVPKQSFFAQPDPFSMRKEFNGSAGVDIKYGVTNTFTMDVAINPDFGQVEVDQAILNLTVFETFYPEKRPLFLEGSQIFSFGNCFDNDQLYLFYSRRIGRQPTLAPPPDSGYVFVENPQVTSILGAAKVTGQTSGGLSVGALWAITDEERGIEENLAGVRKDPILFEPRASYSVLRLRQDVGENSFIGMMATSALKDHFDPALSTGIDWNLRFGERQWAFDGYIAGSQAVSPLSGLASARVTGTAGKFGFGKIEAEHWLYFTLYDFSSNNFWIDDIGFFNVPREHGGYSQISYKENLAAEPFRRYSLNVDGNYRWDWGGVSTLKRAEFTVIGEMRNFWSATVSLLHEFPAYDDASKGMLGLYRRPSNDQLKLQVLTDSRDPVVATLDGAGQIDAKGKHFLSAGLSLTLRPNTWVELSPGVGMSRVRDEEAWLYNFVTGTGFYDSTYTRNLFGDRDIDSYDLSLRGTVTFQRDLSLQFFTQVFLLKGGYRNYRTLDAPDQFSPYGFAYAPPSTIPDFNQQIFRANMVLRWEFLPGSTIYLVWTQERAGLNALVDRTLGENVSQAFRLPMDNVLLAKFTYLWGL